MLAAIAVTERTGMAIASLLLNSYLSLTTPGINLIPRPSVIRCTETD